MDYLGKGCILYIVICIVIGGGYWAYSCMSDGYYSIRCSRLTSNYKEALKTQDFEKAHEVLSEIYTYYDDVVDDNRKEKDFWHTNEKNIKAASAVVCEALKSIYSEEIRFLVYSNTEDCWERVIYCLSEMKSIGRKYDEYTKLSEYSLDPYLAASYQEFVEAKNFLCNLSLNLAIDKGNKPVAKRILKHYLSNCKIDEGSESYDRIIKYTNTDINEAHKKYKKSFVEDLQISPVKTSISGPLSAYFEVVERGYKARSSKGKWREYTITIDFKRKNRKGNILNKEIKLRMKDKDGNIVCSDHHTINNNSPLYHLQLGEIGSVSFDIEEIEGVTSFVVESNS